MTTLYKIILYNSGRFDTVKEYKQSSSEALRECHRVQDVIRNGSARIKALAIIWDGDSVVLWDEHKGFSHSI